MAPSGSALVVFSCVAAIVVEASLKDAVCQDGASWEGHHALGDGTCDDAVVGMLGHLMSMSSLTDEECNSNPMPGLTVRDMILYLQRDCCVGAPMSTYSICGTHYPWGNFCEDPEHFNPKGTMAGGYHCSGDEKEENQAVCQSACMEAWNEHDEEKCDVGRCNFDEEDMYKMSCERVGGSWELHSCLDMYVGYYLMHAQGDPEHLVCTDPGFGQAMVWAGEACCSNWRNGEPDMQTMARTWCHDPAEPSPAPPAEGVCAKIGMEHVRRFEAMGYTPRRCSEASPPQDGRSGYYRYKICSEDKMSYYEGQHCQECGSGHNCADHIHDASCESWPGPYPTGCLGPEAMSWMKGGHKSVYVSCSDDINHPRLTAYSGENCTGEDMGQDYKDVCWDEGDSGSNMGYFDCPVR